MYRLTKKIDALDANTLRLLLGHFLFVFGSISMVTYLAQYSSTFGIRSGFSLGVAGLWVGVWMVKLRQPSLLLSILWVGIMAMLWHMKYGSI